MYQRMRVGGVVVVCSPFMEMVGNVVPSSVGRSVFKVDDNVAVMRGSAWWRVVQFEQISILSIVV
jgi:hypothetical protein